MYYAYNANAIGLGGIIEAPKRKVISSVGSVALAPTGGEGSSVVTGYDADGISFDRSETRVFGNTPDNRLFYTRADVLMKHVNIFDQLQVELMMASVTTVREVIDGEAIDREFLFEASYEGLRVNGSRVIPSINTKLFNTNPTYDGFLSSLGQDDQKQYRAMIGMSNDDVKAMIPRKVSLEMPTIRCSLLAQPVGDHGCALDVRGVGRVFLAEALIKPGRRRLTLFRIELSKQNGSTRFPVLPPDSDTHQATSMQALSLMAPLLPPTDGTPPADGGSLTAGSVEGNGAPGRP
jgi:hypothetical protein